MLNLSERELSVVEARVQELAGKDPAACAQYFIEDSTARNTHPSLGYLARLNGLAVALKIKAHSSCTAILSAGCDVGQVGSMTCALKTPAPCVMKLQLVSIPTTFNQPKSKHSLTSGVSPHILYLSSLKPSETRMTKIHPTFFVRTARIIL